MLKKTKLFKLSLASQAREAEAAAWCSTAWAISSGLWILWEMQLVHAGLREGWLNTTNSTLHTCNVPFSMSHLLLPGQTSCLDITPVQLLSAWISPWRFLLCGKASQWLPWLLRESWERARHNDATQLVFSYYKIGCLHCSRSCEAWFATARWQLPASPALACPTHHKSSAGAMRQDKDGADFLRYTSLQETREKSSQCLSGPSWDWGKPCWDTGPVLPLLADEPAPCWPVPCSSLWSSLGALCYLHTFFTIVNNSASS